MARDVLACRGMSSIDWKHGTGRSTCCVPGTWVHELITQPDSGRVSVSAWFRHVRTVLSHVDLFTRLVDIRHVTQLAKSALILTHTHTRLTALFPGLPRWAGTRNVKPIWIILKQETVSGSGISWATCKSAPCPRQTTTPAPHYSVFYRPDALPAAQPTASKHRRQINPLICINTKLIIKLTKLRIIIRTT